MQSNNTIVCSTDLLYWQKEEICGCFWQQKVQPWDGNSDWQPMINTKYSPSPADNKSTACKKMLLRIWINRLGKSVCLIATAMLKAHLFLMFLFYTFLFSVLNVDIDGWFILHLLSSSTTSVYPRCCFKFCVRCTWKLNASFYIRS